MARPLAEILADLDSGLKRLDAAPLSVLTMTEAKAVLRLQRDAIRALALRLAPAGEVM